MNTKEQINEQLNQLNEEQLNQVADFPCNLPTVVYPFYKMVN